jgi:hypothetical protein
MDNHPHNVELVVQRPDGTIVMTQGAYAGVRAKLLGGQSVRSGTVRVVHAEPTPLPYFDPAYAKPQPIDANALVAVVAAPTQVEPEQPQITTEVFTKSTPTEANPWEDIQVTINEDEVVSAEIISDVPQSNGALNQPSELSPEELFDELINRDLRDFGLTEQEFNALRLSKRQLWLLNERVIGRTANKPTVPQAIRAIIEAANKDGSNYSRVMAAIKRVREIPK